MSHSTLTPNWTNSPGFRTRRFHLRPPGVRLGSRPAPWPGSGPDSGRVDYPDADLNLSWRLQQLTSLRTDPDGRVLRSDYATSRDALYLEHAGICDSARRRLCGCDRIWRAAVCCS